MHLVLLQRGLFCCLEMFDMVLEMVYSNPYEVVENAFFGHFIFR